MRIANLSVSYGSTRVNDEISIEVGAGQMVGLIGANGAGKTTFIDAVSGFVPSTGRVELDDVDLSDLAPHQRARAGIGRTWQSLELFQDLTVRENLLVASQSSTLAALVKSYLTRKPADPEQLEGVLRMLELDHLADRRPTELSHGQQKLVGVARALVGSARVLLLDEPAAGLDRDESIQFRDTIRSVVDGGQTCLMVDHDMEMVLTVCDVVYVLDFGCVIASGPPASIRDDERVIAAYLGARSRSVRDRDHVA